MKPGRRRRVLGPCKVVLAAGGQCDKRGQHKGRAKGDERRKRLRDFAQQPRIGQKRHGAGSQHRPDAHRVHVVKVRPAELDAFGAKAKGLVDHKVGHQRPDPCHRNVGIKPQNMLKSGENSKLHQHQSDAHVEHQPHHAPGMGVGQPREEVRPGDRACIGVGYVDLKLRKDHENTCQREHQTGAVQHLPEGHVIHSCGV